MSISFFLRAPKLGRTLLASVSALAALSVALPAQAFCGFYAGKADASLFNEASQVILVRDGERSVISMLNDYKGPLNQFALIVPTPTAIKQGQVRIAEKASFERLDAYSSPRLAEYHDSDPCQINFNWADQSIHRQAYPAPMAVMSSPREMKAKRSLGVTVEAKFTLEEYDIVSLSAKQSNGLETWLRQNGYHIPKGTSAALKPYIKLGMKFFVAKVNLKNQSQTGFNYLRPLQFAFESEKFMLPMRLGMLNAAPDKQQDLIVYVMSKDGRVESSNYRTAKLPANVNLPAFIKPRFQDFYKAMFANSAKKDDYRAVFTEYFWDMNWCDPCAANPLTPEELRKTGVFWLDGDAAKGFAMLQTPGATMKYKSDPYDSGARPVVLTRLHLRYTPTSFPEDLMLTQTKDKQNWQARYVVQNPYGGSVKECTEKVAQADCEAMCKPRVESVTLLQKENPDWLEKQFQQRDQAYLQNDCQTACKSAKVEGLRAAIRYYREDLPKRIAEEKQTLVNLTGWSMHDVDAMPDAQKYTAASTSPIKIAR